MEEITGQSFTGSVETDGKRFVDCTFTNAVLIYRGGEHPMFERCTFSGSIGWDFLGSAKTTIQFLQRIANDAGGDKFIARLFAKGHYLDD